MSSKYFEVEENRPNALNPERQRIIVDSDELTREEAAKILHVSSAYLDKLIAAGLLPGVDVTDGRERILRRSVLAFKRKLRKQQKAGLRSMTEASERAGLYDAELDGVPPHRRKSTE